MATNGAKGTPAEGSVERGFGERARDAAHRPSSAVAGPYGHPVHPMIVPVAIGAWVCAVAFDIASKAVEGQAYARPAKWLVAIGIVAAVVAAVFGLIDYRRIAKGTRAHKVATTHLLVMDVVLILFVVSFFVRHADDGDLVDGTPTLALVLSVVALVGLLIGGWLGGELAYRFGVRVTDDEDQLAAYVPDSIAAAAKPSDATADDTKADDTVDSDS